MLCGISVKELPIFGWRDNDANNLFRKSKLLGKNGLNPSDEVISKKIGNKSR